MFDTTRPEELSALLGSGDVWTLSLEVTAQVAMLDVDHVSVVEPPGCTRLGVAVSAELIEPGALEVQELYA